MFRRAGLALVALLLTGSAASALSVDVFGVPGTGQTTWTFSGSQTATSAGTFGVSSGVSGIPAVPSQFLNFGNFTDIDFATRPVLSGTASVLVQSGLSVSFLVIQDVFIDDDTTSSDDFGLSFGGATLGFGAGDLVSFSGSVLVGYDLTDLDTSPLPFSQTGSAASDGGLETRLDVTLTISETTAVPVPPGLSLALTGVGVLALFARRRRNA